MLVFRWQKRCYLVCLKRFENSLFSGQVNLRLDKWILFVYLSFGRYRILVFAQHMFSDWSLSCLKDLHFRVSIMLHLCDLLSIILSCCYVFFCKLSWDTLACYHEELYYYHAMNRYFWLFPYSYFVFLSYSYYDGFESENVPSLCLLRYLPSGTRFVQIFNFTYIFFILCESSFIQTAVKPRTFGFNFVLLNWRVLVLRIATREFPIFILKTF